MSRSSQKKLRLGAMAALLAVSSSACVVPVGNPLNIPLVTGCNIFVFEPGAGGVVIPLVEGVVSIGCDFGL